MASFVNDLMAKGITWEELLAKTKPELREARIAGLPDYRQSKGTRSLPRTARLQGRDGRDPREDDQGEVKTAATTD